MVLLKCHAKYYHNTNWTRVCKHYMQLKSSACAPKNKSKNKIPIMKKFFIHTFGCQMNVYDGQRIASMLRGRGYTQTDDYTDADIIILNTCAVRAKATDKVFSALGRIRTEKKPDAIMGIVGCVARESGADAFKRVPELNFVLGPQSYHKLPEILDNPDIKLLNIDLGGLEKFDEMPQMDASPAVAYIPIQEGCNHCCTYCIVPYTRGREISRPFDDVVRDTVHAANTGAIEICFLGQNVNGYKYTDDSGKIYRLSDLIDAAAKLDAIKLKIVAASGETTGVQLYETQWLQLKDIKLKVPKGVTIDLN